MRGHATYEDLLGVPDNLVAKVSRLKRIPRGAEQRGATIDDVEPSLERLWIENWKAAGLALEEQRRLDLRRLTPERALFLTDAVLSLAQPRDLPQRRRTSSGLVELQALFGRLQPR